MKTKNLFIGGLAMVNGSLRLRSQVSLGSLILTLCLLALFCNGLQAQETILYDNLATSGLFGVRPGPGDDYAAQQFLTGEANNVLRATFQLQRVGSPAGQVRVEIWDDNGSGIPGQVVGTLGTIDLPSLALTWQDVTLEGPVTGLRSNSRYYVVLNMTSAGITSIDNSFRGAVTPLDAGTYGAAKLLVTVPGGGWLPLEDPRVLGCHPTLGCPSYARMRATAAPPVRLTIQREVLQRAVVISWPESAGAYALESASTLDGPWKAVTEPVDTLDGTKRVTVLTSAERAFFRLSRQ